MLEVDDERERVAVLGLGLGQEAGSVLALEDVACAVLLELLPAGDVHREDELRLALRGREVVADRVEVDERLVEARRPVAREMVGRARYAGGEGEARLEPRARWGSGEGEGGRRRGRRRQHMGARGPGSRG